MTKFRIPNPEFRILIVGAGPAGASAAIRLAQKGFSVTLIEREKFPRHKLCGEFISPECFAHFAELGVADEMLAAGGDRITETVFYAPNGKSVSVSSAWFNKTQAALGLSRRAMDSQLLEKARKTGARVLEETQAVGLLRENRTVCGIKAKTKSETFEIRADLTIDATGRAGVLRKLAEKDELRATNDELRKFKLRTPHSALRTRLVGFKAHLKNARIEPGRCEIYFFAGGYGGLSRVENDAANHCFLIEAETVRSYGGDAEKIVREVVFRNKRAFGAMRDAAPVFDWLTVAVDGFGAKDLNPAPRLLAIGDAGAFIDPFTGSGMLMALESGKILAEAIAENVFFSSQIAENYRRAHAQAFQNRLRVCRFLRRAAFAPNFARMLISVLSLSRAPVEFLAKATRARLSTLEK